MFVLEMFVGCGVNEFFFASLLREVLRESPEQTANLQDTLMYGGRLQPRLSLLSLLLDARVPLKWRQRSECSCILYALFNARDFSTFAWGAGARASITPGKSKHVCLHYAFFFFVDLYVKHSHLEDKTSFFYLV